MNTLTIIDRQPKENNREYAYRVLRYNIMTFGLEPGEALSEAEICEQLSVSRTPVHEALTMLKSEYLVDIVPQSGSYVSLISLKHIREGVFLRSTVEPAIYRQIAGSAPVEFLKEMKKTIQETEELLYSDKGISIDQFIHLDDHLHYLAYQTAQKPLLWTAMKNVCSHYDRIRYQGSVYEVQDLKHIHKQHRQLYEYLLLGGMASFDLESFYGDHLSYFKSFFSKVMKAAPQYFSED